MDIGLGLWTMQSTVASPTGQDQLHRRFLSEVRTVEELGYHSLWVAEHRFWYDAWTPSPLTLLAGAAAVTTTLRLGTAMALLPQHDPARFARTAVTVDELSQGRLELGVGLGHRDAEYDGLGVERRTRGARMDAALASLLPAWLEQRPATSIWLGGMAPAAIDRGRRAGTSYLLPQTLSEAQVAALVERIRAVDPTLPPTGRIGMLRDVWVTDDAGEAAWFREAVAAHYREEVGSWWVVRGAGHGFRDPDALQAQVRRAVDAAVVGPAAEVGARLARFRDLGVDLVVVRLRFDVTRERFLDAAGRFAAEVLPLLASRGRP